MRTKVLIVLFVIAAMTLPAFSADTSKASSGAKQKVRGVIVKRDAETFVLRQTGGAEQAVELTSKTQVIEKKSNPFRGSRNYAATQLMRGLPVEVEGRMNGSGVLMAEKIRLNDEALLVAESVVSQVVPVEGRVKDAEGRLKDAEGRLAQSEQNAQRLSGQIEELSVVSNAARGGAKAAQQTADIAVAGVNAANDRISSLDDYEARKNLMVQFPAGSAVLTAEAKTALDDFATQAKTEKGFVVEVTGFASADGAEGFNRQLSQRRAEAVVRYLAEAHTVPLRRIIMPFGYGELQPVADNSTRDGRQQNRRVEVKLLLNRGLSTAPAAVARSGN